MQSWSNISFFSSYRNRKRINCLPSSGISRLLIYLGPDTRLTPNKILRCAYPKILREGRGAWDFWTRPKKCPRCKEHCSRNPKRYDGMPQKKFSKIQNDFFQTAFMSTFLSVFFFFLILKTFCSVF